MLPPETVPVVAAARVVGVGGVACFQLESVFKNAAVGAGFLKLLESEFVLNCWSLSQESEHLLHLPTPLFIK